ncbi:hypothetical protein ACFOYW_05975 [Gryllotalpicola reticulitermitis]|uniref:Uncharacterized protein n=1 Tax=Gryllotalpicola reticulitermitis TaxID=1184153 RepID=A0ABV8Q4L3_9MICO
MSASQERPIGAAEFLQLSRAYWLPPYGHGNGLDALTWAQLARVARRQAERMLQALGEAGMPAWTAPADHHTPDSDAAAYDVWVATVDIGAAEDIAMGVLADTGEIAQP